MLIRDGPIPLIAPCICFGARVSLLVECRAVARQLEPAQACSPAAAAERDRRFRPTPPVKACVAMPRRILAGSLLGAGVTAVLAGLAIDASELLSGEGALDLLVVGLVAALLGLGLMGAAAKVGR